VAFSSDGQHLTSAGKDGVVRVWNLATGADPIQLRDHEAMVLGVAFSSDGQQVISASADNTVRVWQRTRGTNPVVLRGHQNWVYDAKFSLDGRQVASASADGTVRLWRCEGCGSLEEVLALAEKRSTRELTSEERQTFLYKPPRS